MYKAWLWRLKMSCLQVQTNRGRSGRRTTYVHVAITGTEQGLSSEEEESGGF